MQLDGNCLLFEAPDTGRQEKVVQRDYRQQAGSTPHGQLNADTIGQDADKKNTDHGYAPVHHVHAHDPSLMDIIGIGQQQRVA